ncbi:MAG TPA: DUF488 family protein [Anaerolineaceae bacterium]|nr:DUF488 family protein [Anaerolineaceae bacterium]
MAEIKIKRAYEPPALEDDTRILVDRLWPRGKTKASLELHSWAKAMAPSNELRKTFGHMADKFDQFVAAYHMELNSNPASPSFVQDIKEALKNGNVTLIYGAKDEEHNQALVLKAWLEEKFGTQ